jgi:hypothetical protein
MKGRIFLLFLAILSAYLFQKAKDPVLSFEKNTETADRFVATESRDSIPKAEMRLPSSVMDSKLNDFENEAIKKALSTIPRSLQTQMTVKTLRKNSQFTTLKWLFLGVEIEGSEERWVWDESKKAPKLQVASMTFENASYKEHLNFQTLSDEQLKNILNESLSAEDRELVTVIGKPQKFWQRGSNASLIPVYEIALRTLKAKQFSDEIWRINPDTKKVIQRAPQSRHGSHQDQGIQLKTDDHEGF